MHVLIAGAGIGGMMLACLLEQAAISYVILEQSDEVKQLGSAMALGAHIFPAFRQLGLEEEIKRHALPCYRARCRFSQSERIEWEQGYEFAKKRYGEYVHIIDRIKLYEIISRQVPQEKIVFGKKVLHIHQNDEGVMIRCHDGSTFHGHILIGADGAYSSVRQNLYRHLKKENLLPKEDDKDPPFNTTCLVGTTHPLPPGTVESEDGVSRCASMLYKNQPYFTVCFTGTDRRVSWMVLESSGNYRTRDDQRFRESEWRTEGALAMAEQVRDLSTPFGPTMGTFIDNTPKERITKVRFEEKVFKTWTHGRTALLGDACHKFYPAMGQGAVNAMLDAVVLANVLDACPSTNIDDVRRCLEAYRDERYPAVKLAFNASVKGAYVCKRTFVGNVVRTFYKILPQNVFIGMWDEMYTYQPQVSFLPFESTDGTFRPAPQKDYNFLRVSATSVPS